MSNTEVILELKNINKDCRQGRSTIEVLKNVIKRDGDLKLVIKEVENIKNLGKKNIWSETETSFIYSYITKEEIKDVSVVSQQEIITIIPIGTKLDVGNALELNPYTKVWKIIQ